MSDFVTWRHPCQRGFTYRFYRCYSNDHDEREAVQRNLDSDFFYYYGFASVEEFEREIEQTSLLRYFPKLMKFDRYYTPGEILKPFVNDFDELDKAASVNDKYKPSDLSQYFGNDAYEVISVVFRMARGRSSAYDIRCLYHISEISYLYRIIHNASILVAAFYAPGYYYVPKPEFTITQLKKHNAKEWDEILKQLPEGKTYMFVSTDNSEIECESSNLHQLRPITWSGKKGCHSGKFHTFTIDSDHGGAGFIISLGPLLGGGSSEPGSSAYFFKVWLPKFVEFYNLEKDNLVVIIDADRGFSRWVEEHFNGFQVLHIRPPMENESPTLQTRPIENVVSKVFSGIRSRGSEGANWALKSLQGQSALLKLKGIGTRYLMMLIGVAQTNFRQRFPFIGQSEIKNPAYLKLLIEVICEFHEPHDFWPSIEVGDITAQEQAERLEDFGSVTSIFVECNAMQLWATFNQDKAKAELRRLQGNRAEAAKLWSNYTEDEVAMRLAAAEASIDKLALKPLNDKRTQSLIENNSILALCYSYEDDLRMVYGAHVQPSMQSKVHLVLIDFTYQTSNRKFNEVLCTCTGGQFACSHAAAVIKLLSDSSTKYTVVNKIQSKHVSKDDAILTQYYAHRRDLINTALKTEGEAERAAKRYKGAPRSYRERVIPLHYKNLDVKSFRERMEQKITGKAKYECSLCADDKRASYQKFNGLAKHVLEKHTSWCNDNDIGAESRLTKKEKFDKVKDLLDIDDDGNSVFVLANDGEVAAE